MLVLLCEFEAKNFHLNKSRVPGKAGGGVNHRFPGDKGDKRPLGNILFVDELAVLVAAREAVVRIGGTDAVLGAERGGGHEFLVPGVDEGA